VLGAETAYDFVICDAASRARACGELTWRVGERIHSVQWELRANAVWRFGRVFFRCVVCGRLAARLYLPGADARTAACRRCYGLSYESRQANYRDNVGRLRHIGLSARAFAFRETWLWSSQDSVETG
jgi:hypothetical protein